MIKVIFALSDDDLKKKIKERGKHSFITETVSITGDISIIMGLRNDREKLRRRHRMTPRAYHGQTSSRAPFHDRRK